MRLDEQITTGVAGITLVAGTVLTLFPQTFTGPAGLPGEAAGVRTVGIADLLLAPGIHAGRPRWPWMVGRAAVSLMQSAYLDATVDRAGRKGLVAGSARTLRGLAVMDLVTAAACYRAETA